MKYLRILSLFIAVLSFSIQATGEERVSSFNALENALNNSIKEAKVNIDKHEDRARSETRAIQSADEEIKVIKVKSTKVNVSSETN